MINQRSISLGLLLMAGGSAPPKTTPAAEAPAATHVRLIDVSNGRLRENVTVLMREFTGRLDRYGSIEAGTAAALVRRRGNPLADIANTRSVEATVLGGVLVDRPTPTP